MTTSTQKTSVSGSVLELQYTLDSITRTTSPVADDTRDWHSYVIIQGTNRIVGHRPGSAETVRVAAQDLVMRLNERRSYSAGRKNLIIAHDEKR